MIVTYLYITSCIDHCLSNDLSGIKPHCRASTAVTSMRHFSAQILASSLIPRIKGAWERMTTSTNCGEFTGNFMVNLMVIQW